MDGVNLDDILLTPLARFPSADGDVLHGMKRGDAGYAGFGEAYFSWVNHGAVKAWKRHRRMVMNLVVPLGQVRFVFLEEHTGLFRIEDVGVARPVRLTVPAGIWFGFKGLATPNSLLLNLASIPHDPDETDRRGVADINYAWDEP